MLPKLKRFDVHVKAADGVNQQTFLGAFITVVSVVVVGILLFSEITLFLKVDVVSRMVADSTAGFESVKLEIDVDFHGVRCDNVNFFQEVTRGTLHIQEQGVIEKIGSGPGCRLTGEIITDKAGGNFRFSIDTPSNTNTLGNLMSNFSHTINHIAFVSTQGLSAVDKIPGLANILNHQVSIVPENTGIYQYSIQVVPTQYKTLYGVVSFANQYSVSEKVITLDQLRKNEAVSGLFLKDFKGLIFTYDFHPVMLFMEERRERIVDFVSNLFGIIGGVITILSLLETVLHQSTKAIIDEVTGTARPEDGIIELSGEAGCGKTQVCLTLALQTQLPVGLGGLLGSTAYLSCGEGLFPIKRLSQMASSYESKLGTSSEEILSKIHIEQCFNIDNVLDTLSNKIPEMCQKQGIKLLVIDSIAGLLRHEFDTQSAKEMAERTTFLFKLASKLKWLSNTFHLCIVVVNQVTANFDTRGSSDQTVVPAMGIAWTHCINSRIVLERRGTVAPSNLSRVIGTANSQNAHMPVDSVIISGNGCAQCVDYDVNDSEDIATTSNRHFDVGTGSIGKTTTTTTTTTIATPGERYLTLVFSPRKPSASCKYTIVDSGVRGLPD